MTFRTRFCVAAIVAAISSVTQGAGAGEAGGTKFTLRNNSVHPITVTAFNYVDGKRALPTQTTEIPAGGNASLACETPVCSLTASFVLDGRTVSLDGWAPISGLDCIAFNVHGAAIYFGQCWA